MPGFLDKIKEGAEKAGFEADRLRRLNQAQSALKELERQLQTDTAAMGRQVLALYDAGTLAQPELASICRQIDALRQRISARAAEIERIRVERPPEAPGPALYGHICPRCQIQLPDDVAFCGRCGSKAVYIAPPAVPAGTRCPFCNTYIPPGARFCPKDGTPVELAAPPPPITCSTCHAAVPAEAVFCPSCGASIPPPVRETPQAKSVIVPGTIVCPSCHASIPPEAVFCPECGSSITAAVAAQPASEQVWPEVEEEVDRIICPRCQAKIPAEAVICPECGFSLVAVAPEPTGEKAPSQGGELLGGAICPNCHASIPAEAVFCPECGAQIESTPVEAATAEVLSEQEQASAEVQAPPPAQIVEMQELPDEEKTALPTACPSCQAVIPAEAEFCPECGEPIPPGAAKPE